MSRTGTDKLTEEQAYRAMLEFLERQYERTRSEDLAVLLGSAAMLDDGNSADPALFQEWKACLRSVAKSGTGQVAAE